jgi:hypothetical protein
MMHFPIFPRKVEAHEPESSYRGPGFSELRGFSGACLPRTGHRLSGGQSREEWLSAKRVEDEGVMASVETDTCRAGSRFSGQMETKIPKK